MSDLLNKLEELKNEAISVIDSASQDQIEELKIKYLQFVQCVEQDPSTGRVAEFSITAEQYGDFLCRIFDRWI